MVGLAKFLLFLQLVIVGAAMGAVGFMPIGALAGAAVVAWLSLKFRNSVSDRVALGAGYGLFVLAGLSVAGWFLVEELTDGNPFAQGKEPWVHIEWRLPEKLEPEQVGQTFRHTMRSPYMDWTLTTKWDDPDVRYEGGQTILRLRGQLRWRLSGRIFQLWRAPAHQDRITISLNLGPDPKRTDDYGPWVDVEGYSGQAYRVRVE